MNISVDMPSCETEVPGCIAKVNAQIRAKQAEMDALIAMRKGMRAMCSHPRKFYSSDIDGGGDHHCPYCGWMSCDFTLCEESCDVVGPQCTSAVTFDTGEAC